MSSTPRPSAIRPALTLALTLTALGAGRVHAQLYTADPYDPYGRAYKAFAYPGAGNNPSLPNATRYQQGPYGGSMANQFDRYADDLIPGRNFGLGSRFAIPGVGSPDASEDATPSERADAKFFEARQKREQAMLRALRERDPKKRDEMIRKINEEFKSGSVLGRSIRRGASASTVPAAPSVVRRPRTPASARTPSTAPPVGATTPPAARPGVGSTPPPPPIGTSSPPRRSAVSTPTPREVLERARRLRAQEEGGPAAGTIPPPPATGRPR